MGKAFDEPTVRAAFIRLYRLTRWEDLSLSLAPLLALSEHDSATLIDRETERFIDANMAALDPEDVGPGAWEILERKRVAGSGTDHPTEESWGDRMNSGRWLHRPIMPSGLRAAGGRPAPV